VEPAAAPAVARLRTTRGHQEAIVRSLALLAPLLLGLLVVLAARVGPGFGWSGRGLVVSLGVAVFVIAVLGRNATARHTDRGLHVGFVAALVASAATLMWVQPSGPGAECMLLAILCVARLLPVRIAVPLLVVGFVAVEGIVVLTNRDVGRLFVLTAFAAFYGMLFLAFRLAEANKQAERLLAALQASQATQAQAAAFAERQYLAREMHDVLAHSLSGLMLQLEGARMMAAGGAADQRLTAAIERAHRLAKSGLDEARQAIGALRGDELPGPDGLPSLAAKFTEDRGIPCRLVVDGDAYDLSSESRLAVYRVVQEALTNIAKHAGAERVAIQITYRPDRVQVRIEDFGAASAVVTDAGSAVTTVGSAGLTDAVTISAEAAGETGGYGLTGMRERAELLGGTLIAEHTGTGFRVELEVPA
jgi:signal transduction histidine kinase